MMERKALRITMEIKFDRATKAWFDSKRFGEQTTLCRCDKCGLFYKPMLGHKCKNMGDSEHEK